MPRHGLRRYSNSVVVVYYLSRTVLRDLPARCAYHTAKSLSKPLRPPIKEKDSVSFFVIITKIRKKVKGERKIFRKGKRKNAHGYLSLSPFSAAAARFDKTIQKACCFVKRILLKNIVKVALFSCEKIHEIVKSP